MSQPAQESHLLESGQMISTHTRDQCFGEWCAIHKPQPGPWETWPRLWRDDRGIMERICPCGVGHPVAEMYEWAIEYGRGYDLVHGCCSEHQCGPRTAKREVFVHSGEGGSWRLGVPDAEAPTTIPAGPVESTDVTDVNETDLEIMIHAVQLMIQLWPSPPGSPVTISPDTWVELRRVLSYVPELVERVSNK